MPPIKENLAEAVRLLNAREAADYLRISLSTLNRMERKGDITPLRTPGGQRRYTLEMLHACLHVVNLEDNER
jgi:excisionase family DNA binding protein